MAAHLCPLWLYLEPSSSPSGPTAAACEILQEEFNPATPSFTIRCTQKLLARLGSAPVTIITTPDTVLGDWCANLNRVGRMQVVLAVSERTLFPLVVPAKEFRTRGTHSGESSKRRSRRPSGSRADQRFLRTRRPVCSMCVLGGLTKSS
ncbi:DUF6933 domain-containing protein [Delftia sp. GW456-R20]|uniref:DUF6933 domain-containing protein n=1 Tax=Delftia sp. GW456-R20 TaxID=1827145 RepID=UPI003FA4A839